MRFWRRSELAKLESELREARPEAPDHLVASVSDRLEPSTIPYRRLRVVMVGVVTALLLFGFAAFGGVSYATKGALAVVTANGGGGNNFILGGGDEDDDNGGRDGDEDDDDPDDDQYDDDDDDDRDDDDDGGADDKDDDDGGQENDDNDE